MNAQKNYTLELLKLFASYMVVFIHVLFYGQMGVIMDTLARFAVPLFFLVSGYYSFQIRDEKIKKRIIKLLTLFIIAAVCYTLLNVIPFVLRGNANGISAYFSNYLNIATLIKAIVFNVPVSATHLWYLLASIYVYIVFYFVTVLHLNEKLVYFVSFALLFLHILLGECLTAVGILVPRTIMRNFALMGIPFFVLGLFVKKHDNKLKNVPNHVIIIAVVIGVFASLFSRYSFGENQLYIGSLFILFAMVATFIKYSTAKYPPFLNALSGCSTYIYIFHIMISVVINEIYKLFNINFNSSVVLQYVHPIIVCIVSTAVAYGIIQFLKLFSAKKQK